MRTDNYQTPNLSHAPCGLVEKFGLGTRLQDLGMRLPPAKEKEKESLGMRLMTTTRGLKLLTSEYVVADTVLV